LLRLPLRLVTLEAEGRVVYLAAITHQAPGGLLRGGHTVFTFGPRHPLETTWSLSPPSARSKPRDIQKQMLKATITRARADASIMDDAQPEKRPLILGRP
jgi:hypothetical protein